MVTGLGAVLLICFKMVKELQDIVLCDVLEGQFINMGVGMFGQEAEEQHEGISIGSTSIPAYSSYIGKVDIEVVVQTGEQVFIFSFHRVSNS